MTEKKTTWARIQMLLIASVFFGPLAVATWMYYTGAFIPEGHTNNGALLEPIVSIAEALPHAAIIEQGDGVWILIYADDKVCAEACENALYTIRQTRKMLGKEMDRVIRVFLHGDTSPDTVFLAEEHTGLIAMRDSELSSLLYNKKPVALEAGGYYLMDPLGNLVMYFQPDIDPRDMVEDIKHLLKFSRIG